MNSFWMQLRRRLRIGRKYKDNLFCDIFSRDREALLQLYNAMNGTDYDNSSEIEIVTLENALYIGHKNDLAYLISGTINLYEHQSTENPNMPARFLIYLAEEYQKIIEKSDRSSYGSAIITLPVPKFVVFYNGSGNFLTKEYHLSDAFVDKKADADVTVRVRIININAGCNEALMKKCNTLDDYAQFIELVRKYEQHNDTKTAIMLAIKEALEKGILESYLRERQAEVPGMLLYDFDRKKYEKTLRLEGREEGREEGRIEMLREDILDILEDLGEVSSELEEKINAETDELALKRMLKIAARSGNIVEFEEKIGLVVSQTGRLN